MSYSSEVLADSPLVYYRLGEASGTTAADSSGNSHPGTYHNAPTLGVTGLSGDADTAVSFAAQNSFASSQYVASNATFGPTTYTAFSLEALIDPTSFPSTTLPTICGFYPASALDAAFLYVDEGAGTLVFTLGFDAVSAPIDLARHHVVGAYDGTTLRLYIDGIQVDHKTSPGAVVLTGADTFYVGTNENDFYSFDGVIDEAALYNTELGPSRVAAHATAAGFTVPTIVPSRVAAVAAVPAATIHKGVLITASAVAATAGIPSPTVTPALVTLPTITSLTPDSGSVDGGTSVVITGTNLTDATDVTFDGDSADFTVDDDTQITATSPAHSIAEFVDVEVTTPDGSDAALFEYTTVIGLPTVDNVTPSSGSTSGGYEVVLTGHNFTGATLVRYLDQEDPPGFLNAGDFTVDSDTQITILSIPPTFPGITNFTVQTPAGDSEFSSDDSFTFVGGPPPICATPQFIVSAQLRAFLKLTP